MKKSNKAQHKVAKVMREFKMGELKSSSGEKVTDRKQAIAIALSEARAIDPKYQLQKKWEGGETYNQAGKVSPRKSRGMIPSEIDATISAKYNIGRYGTKGMEIQSGNERIKIFNDKPTDYENWVDAVKWARENKEKIKMNTGGKIPDDIYWALYNLDSRLVDVDLNVKTISTGGSFLLTVGKAKEGTDDRHKGFEFIITKQDVDTNERKVWDYLNERKGKSISVTEMAGGGEATKDLIFFNVEGEPIFKSLKEANARAKELYEKNPDTTYKGVKMGIDEWRVMYGTDAKSFFDTSKAWEAPLHKLEGGGKSDIVPYVVKGKRLKKTLSGWQPVWETIQLLDKKPKKGDAEKHRNGFNASLEKGGANEHLGANYRVTDAKIINQKTGEEIDFYKAPTFETFDDGGGVGELKYSYKKNIKQDGLYYNVYDNEGKRVERLGELEDAKAQIDKMNEEILFGFDKRYSTPKPLKNFQYRDITGETYLIEIRDGKLVEESSSGKIKEINPNVLDGKNNTAYGMYKNDQGSFKKEHATGGEVDDRMYNFLNDDLKKLEKAVSEGDKEEIERFFSYWNYHLKSLKTKTNDRMYNFLKDDLKKLEKAVSEGDKEEVERFFSYWGYHLKSLKMAQGGSMPARQGGTTGGGVEDSQLKEMANGYMSAILFTENDYEDQSLDRNYGTEDFASETVDAINKMLTQYINANKGTIESSGMDNDQIGMDIWYTQKGHGVGFFDRDLDKDVEKKLTDSAKALARFPEIEIDSKNKIHVRGVEKYHEGGDTNDNNNSNTMQSEKVKMLIDFANSNEKLMDEKVGIMNMADEMKWDKARLHQQFKRIFSYMAETSYNKQNPDSKIELTEAERNEFADILSQSSVIGHRSSVNPPDVKSALQNLTDANAKLNEAESHADSAEDTIEGARTHVERAVDDLEGNPLPFKNGGGIPDNKRPEGFSRLMPMELNTAIYKDRIYKFNKDDGMWYVVKQEIPNNYKGKTPEQVWDEWTPEQRTHFINDHFKGHHYLDSLIKYVNYDWNDFPDIPIKSALDHAMLNHVLEGQYKNAGRIENQYAGKGIDDVWNAWTNDQKHHFLLDHIRDVRKEKDIQELMKIEKFDLDNFDTLEDWQKEMDREVVEGWKVGDIRNYLLGHIREGQYDNAGKVTNPYDNPNFWIDMAKKYDYFWIDDSFGKNTVRGGSFNREGSIHATGEQMVKTFPSRKTAEEFIKDELKGTLIFDPNEVGELAFKIAKEKGWYDDEDGYTDIKAQNRSEYLAIKQIIDYAKKKGLKMWAGGKLNDGGSTYNEGGEVKKVATSEGYDYYVGEDKGRKFYNLVPEGSPAPSRGYHSAEYISRLKGVYNLFEYAPLRSVIVTYDDGTVIPTSMASGLTDEQIRDYFKVGRTFNIGSGERDKMVKVKSVEILKSHGGSMKKGGSANPDFILGDDAEGYELIGVNKMKYKGDIYSWSSNAKGWYKDTPTKTSSVSSKEKQKLADKIAKLEKALESGKLSAKARETMEKKLTKYKTDVSRRIPVYERMIQSKGKFYIEIPSEYRMKMNTLLHGANLKPRYNELDGKLRITVDNKAKLNRLYKIYSGILAKKKLSVPSLKEISGKPSKVKRQK